MFRLLAFTHVVLYLTTAPGILETFAQGRATFAFLDYQSSEISLLLKGHKVPVESEERRLSAAVLDLERIASKSYEVANGTTLQSALDYVTICSERTELRQKLLKNDALDKILDAYEALGSSSACVFATRCLSRLTRHGEQSLYPDKPLAVKRVIQFAVRSFTECDHSSHIHSMDTLRHLASVPSVKMEVCGGLDKVNFEDVASWAKTDSWVQVNWPQLAVARGSHAGGLLKDEPTVRLEVVSTLVNHAHAAVTLLHTLSKCRSVIVDHRLQEKLHWLITEEGESSGPPFRADSALHTFRAAFALLQQQDSEVVKGSDLSQSAWERLVAISRQFSARRRVSYSQQEEKMKAILPQLYDLVVDGPSHSDELARLFSLFPVAKDMLDFALTCSTGLYEELAMSCLQRLFRNYTPAYLRTQEGAGKIALLLRSPYVSVRANVLAMVPQVTKSPEAFEVFKADAYLPVLLVDYLNNSVSSQVLKDAHCRNTMGRLNCSVETWNFVRSSSDLTEPALQVILAALRSDPSGPRQAWESLTRRAPQLRDLIWQTTCSASHAGLAEDILLESEQIGPAPEALAHNLCAFQEHGQTIAHLALATEGAYGPEELQQLVKTTWRFAVHEKERRSVWSPMWIQGRVPENLLKIAVTSELQLTVELALLALLEGCIQSEALSRHVALYEFDEILEVLQLSRARNVLSSCLMLLATLIHHPEARDAYARSIPALQQTGKLIQPGPVATLTDTMTLHRTVYSLAIYPLDLIFRLLTTPNGTQIVVGLFEAVPVLESRIWQVSCFEDLRVRQYVANITATLGIMLVEYDDPMSMQACEYTSTIMIRMVVVFEQLQEAVAANFADATATKDAVYDIFQFVLEFKKYVIPLIHQIKRHQLIENLLAILHKYQGDSLVTELAAHSLAVISTVPEYHSYFCAVENGTVASLLKLQTTSRQVQVVALNILSELFAYPDCEGRITADTVLHEHLVNSVIEEDVEVIKNVALLRGIASFSHYSTLLLFKLIHLNSLPGIKENPSLEGNLWQATCSNHLAVRQQATLVLEVLGKVDVQHPDPDSLQACNQGKWDKNKDWIQATSFVGFLYVVAMFIAYSVWEGRSPPGPRKDLKKKKR